MAGWVRWTWNIITSRICLCIGISGDAFLWMKPFCSSVGGFHVPIHSGKFVYQTFTHSEQHGVNPGPNQESTLMQNIRLLKPQVFLNEALKPNYLYLQIAICAGASASLKLMQNLAILVRNAGYGDCHITYSSTRYLAGLELAGPWVFLTRFLLLT